MDIIMNGLWPDANLVHAAGVIVVALNFLVIDSSAAFTCFEESLLNLTFSNTHLFISLSRQQNFSSQQSSDAVIPTSASLHPKLTDPCLFCPKG